MGMMGHGGARWGSVGLGGHGRLSGLNGQAGARSHRLTSRASKSGLSLGEEKVGWRAVLTAGFVLLVL